MRGEPRRHACTYISCPLLSKPGFGGINSMSVGDGGSLRRVQGWTHPQEMQPNGRLRDPRRSIETRRRFSSLRMVFTRCAPLPSSNLVPFGRRWYARGRGHCHCPGKPGRAQEHAQAYRGTLYRVDSQRGRRAVRSTKSPGSAQPLCVRIKGANLEVFEGKADL